MSVRASERKSGRAWCRICPTVCFGRHTYGPPRCKRIPAGAFDYRSDSNPTPSCQTKNGTSLGPISFDDSRI